MPEQLYYQPAGDNTWASEDNQWYRYYACENKDTEVPALWCTNGSGDEKDSGDNAYVVSTGKNTANFPVADTTSECNVATKGEGADIPNGNGRQKVTSAVQNSSSLQRLTNGECATNRNDDYSAGRT